MSPIGNSSHDFDVVEISPKRSNLAENHDKYINAKNVDTPRMSSPMSGTQISPGRKVAFDSSVIEGEEGIIQKSEQEYNHFDNTWNYEKVREDRLSLLKRAKQWIVRKHHSK